jgi:hypothetical protein
MHCQQSAARALPFEKLVMHVKVRVTFVRHHGGLVSSD